MDPDFTIEWLHPGGPQAHELSFHQHKGKFVGISAKKTDSQNLEQAQIEHQNRDCKALCLFICRIAATIPVFLAGTIAGTLHGIVCALVLSLEIACMHLIDFCGHSLENCCITSPYQILVCLIKTTMDIGIILFCVPVTGFSLGGYYSYLLLWDKANISDINTPHQGMTGLKLPNSSLNQFVHDRFDELTAES